MITEELLKYIESERKVGKDEARIREVLKSEGWSEEDLNEGFGKIKNSKFEKYKLSSSGFSFLFVIVLLPLILRDLSLSSDDIIPGILRIIASFFIIKLFRDVYTKKIKAKVTFRSVLKTILILFTLSILFMGLIIGIFTGFTFNFS